MDGFTNNFRGNIDSKNVTALFKKSEYGAFSLLSTMVCLKIVAFLVLCSGLVAGEKNNVCSTYSDYFFIDTSPNCWYDPDIDSDIFQILARKNISIETHNLESQDGYILTMFRLPRPNPKGVVFLVHPMTQTPRCWFADIERSLGFLLYQDGYELWLPNVRGTYYSSGHHNISDNEYRYWNFTFHEMGVYDIPAELDMVRNVTKRSDIIYIGYSLSTTSAMVYASQLPEHAKKTVKLFILLAPVIYPQQMSSSFNSTKVEIWLERHKFGSLAQFYGSTKFLLRSLCAGRLKILCGVAIFGAEGIRNFDPIKTTFIYSNMYTRIPLKVMHHYRQIKEEKRFQQYSYGVEGNRMLYKSPQPPLYPINNIKVPVYSIHGGKDLAMQPKNTERFYGELPREAKIYGKLLIPEFNHLDFVFARQFKEKVIDPIFEVLKKLK